jgi:hypothetical protein
MAIDGHAHREPPPLPSRAYLSTPGPPSAPPSPTPSFPTLLAISLRPNRARHRRPLNSGAGVDLHRRRLPRHSLGRLSFIVW